MEQWLNVLHVLVFNTQVADGHFYSQSECTVFGLWGSSTIKSTTDSTELFHEQQLALANLKRWHKIKTGRKERRKDMKGGKNGEWQQQQWESKSYIYVFLPGWVWCRLHCQSQPEHRRRSRRPQHSPDHGSMHSQQEERGRQERRGMQESRRGREVIVWSNGRRR